MRRVPNSGPGISPLGRLAHVSASVSWFLVLFYIVASCRALFPGLCATQAAMDAQCGVDPDAPALSSTTHGCCPVPQADGVEQDRNKRPITPAESHCAFCNLIIGLTDPPERLVLPAPAEPRFAERIPLAMQIAQEVHRDAAPNRAPPA